MRIFSTASLDEQRALISILVEMKDATVKHPNWPDDVVHRAAIVTEKAGELIRAALNHHYEGGELAEMNKESIQTGATALRFIVNSKKGGSNG
ncbi:hypothetical protein C900_05389 [Fulvivirga imtechensis AK7]|uniref:Uncharacterized protein n=1 Tax=Fulvivirga imtechensis AK7 TaxID=1237149 RepID=L8JLS8_9BACT|nr:hypothetical protein [Fulvivirga imtechensis]ELR69193.1 hypothetical protein C900_05389 [Fulvivirga imtechensis AK7]